MSAIQTAHKNAGASKTQIAPPWRCTHSAPFSTSTLLLFSNPLQVVICWPVYAGFLTAGSFIVRAFKKEVGGLWLLLSLSSFAPPNVPCRARSVVDRFIRSSVGAVGVDPVRLGAEPPPAAPPAAPASSVFTFGNEPPSFAFIRDAAAAPGAGADAPIGMGSGGAFIGGFIGTGLLTRLESPCGAFARRLEDATAGLAAGGFGTGTGVSLRLAAALP